MDRQMCNTANEVRRRLLNLEICPNCKKEVKKDQILMRYFEVGQDGIMASHAPKPFGCNLCNGLPTAMGYSKS